MVNVLNNQIPWNCFTWNMFNGKQNCLGRFFFELRAKGEKYAKLSCVMELCLLKIKTAFLGPIGSLLSEYFLPYTRNRIKMKLALVT